MPSAKSRGLKGIHLVSLLISGPICFSIMLISSSNFSSSDSETLFLQHGLYCSLQCMLPLKKTEHVLLKTICMTNIHIIKEQMQALLKSFT